MIYELINPSDRVHFGATPSDETCPDVPILLFGDAEAWWGEAFPTEPSLDGWLERNTGKVATALRSVCYGDLTERRLYDSAVAAIDDPDKRSAFVARWNDAHRSSLNDIMGRAHQVADQIEAAGVRDREPAIG